MKKIKILIVDDNKEFAEDTSEVLNESILKDNYELECYCETDFDNAIEKITELEIDVIVLDVFKGDVSESNPQKCGDSVFNKLRENIFVPVIFNTGLINHVKPYESNVVRIVRKGDNSIENIKNEIENLIDKKILDIRKRLLSYVESSLKDYFWDFVYTERDKLKDLDSKDITFNYLFARRFNSLMGKNLLKVLGCGDELGKYVHPLVCYIYPQIEEENYVAGEIIKKDNSYYVLLTPNCDLVRGGRRNATNSVLIAKCIKLIDTDKYKDYIQDNSDKNKDKLKKFLTANNNTRYFYMPKTIFIDDLIIDLTLIENIEYDSLTNDFERVARLADPYSQAVSTQFARHYNRVGTDDLDIDKIIENYSS